MQRPCGQHTKGGLAAGRPRLTRQHGATGPSLLARADWFMEALKDKGIKPCIPGRKSRGRSIRHDKRRYKRRNRIEIMFGRLKDWRRVATRQDRCPKVFLSAVALRNVIVLAMKQERVPTLRSVQRCWLASIMACVTSRRARSARREYPYLGHPGDFR